MKQSVLECAEPGFRITPVGGEVWMTKHEIATLFECFVAKVDANVRSILRSAVLNEDKVCRTLRYADGSLVLLYNMEMIIALAFRIRSRNADAFRRWLVARAVAGRKISVVVPLSNQAIVN